MKTIIIKTFDCIVEVLIYIAFFTVLTVVHSMGWIYEKITGRSL